MVNARTELNSYSKRRFSDPPVTENLPDRSRRNSSGADNGTGGPLKPDFGLSGDVTRHRLSPTDKLNCPPRNGGLRVLAAMQQDVRDDGDRVGIDFGTVSSSMFTVSFWEHGIVDLIGGTYFIGAFPH